MPVALKPRHLYDIKDRRLVEDSNDADIMGVSAFDEDQLLCTDYENRVVKLLTMSTGLIRPIFVERDRSWVLRRALHLEDADGPLLCVSMWNHEKRRVVIARPDKDGTFHTREHIVLPDCVVIF